MLSEDELSSQWLLCLYVAGMSPASKRALANIKAIGEEYLKGHYSIDVIDLLERPALAERHQIFAVPTLVRQIPMPLRKIIGDLADVEKVLAGLNIPFLAPSHGIS